MNAEDGPTDRETRWDDAKDDHWHGAEATPETAQRETDAQTADDTEAQSAADEQSAEDADTDAQARAHEGRIGRWEAATGRTWNRNHGTGS